MGECFFWYWPTRVVPDQRVIKQLCVIVMNCTMSGVTQLSFDVHQPSVKGFGTDVDLRRYSSYEDRLSSYL